MPKLIIDVPQDDFYGLSMELVSRGLSFQVIADDKKTAKKQPRQKVGSSKTRNTRAGKIILDEMEKGNDFPATHFNKLFKEAGYSETSTSSTLSALFKEGDVTRVHNHKGLGYIYNLAKKGKPND